MIRQNIPAIGRLASLARAERKPYLNTASTAYDPEKPHSMGLLFFTLPSCENAKFRGCLHNANVIVIFVFYLRNYLFNFLMYA